MLARSLSKQLFRPAAAAAFRAPLLRQFHATPPALVVRPVAAKTRSAIADRERANLRPHRTLQAVGDKIPSIELDHGFAEMVKVDLAERCAGRKVILLGLPGAFTPC
jgi:hypothetical protein